MSFSWLNTMNTVNSILFQFLLPTTSPNSGLHHCYMRNADGWTNCNDVFWTWCQIFMHYSLRNVPSRYRWTTHTLYIYTLMFKVITNKWYLHNINIWNKFLDIEISSYGVPNIPLKQIKSAILKIKYLKFLENKNNEV